MYVNKLVLILVFIIERIIFWVAYGSLKKFGLTLYLDP